MTPRPDHLDLYRKKRDPARTPEPFGEGESTAEPALGGMRFVVQKHAARALHYDFRLELDGVLKSWSVPKGPSVHVEEKRLAVHVEDHPLEYANFEGIIPAGNYGAGEVIVWDHGHFGTFKKNDDVLEQYHRGKLELEMFGLKLRGRWTLVRMSRAEKEWLLLKKDDDAAAADELVDRYPESVISGLTVEEMKDPPAVLAGLQESLRASGAPEREVALKDVKLMLATLTERPPAGKDWSFEIKYDGVRVLAWRHDKEVRLQGRSGEDITARYPEIAAALADLFVPQFLLDGEIVAADDTGRPSFQRLQARMHLKKPRDIQAARARVPVKAYFFDCLAAGGFDLRKLPLGRRQEVLARVAPPRGVAERAEHVLEHGPAFLEAADELRLEGIVAKKLTSVYDGRRSADWLKIKCQRRDDFVIGGYTDPQGSRSGFGALLVGRYEGDKLVYVTRVGTGLDGKTIAELHRALQDIARPTSPFDERSPSERGNHWAEPRLVCEVRFTEWTEDGGLRHPTYLGLRSDKKPEECRREEPVDLTAPLPVAARALEAEPEDRDVKITNPRKVYWPDGYTKSDLVAYYESIAPLLLPYLRDRPVVLTRYPDGIEGKSFFQKDAPVYTPRWVRTVTVTSGHGERDIRYFVLDDIESLRYVANLGTIPLHVWSARVDSLEEPDWLVIDLDPKGAPFKQVVQVARIVKSILDELDLPSAVKTSGATGLHILLPMGRRYSDEETRAFAKLLAVLVVDEAPEISTVARPIHQRGGKVYVDFGQNGRGNTIVAPYSLRPLPGAPASCPLLWDEVNAKLDPARFTLRTLPKRFEKMADPLAMVLGPGLDMQAAIARIDRRMNGGDPAPHKKKRKTS
ncbi:MAG TPA: DNA ligase D [Candidatus Eisenbacteria bacterium]|nr:DNA ligase D [Candidatus Eisenbacteria bacterium]